MTRAFALRGQAANESPYHYTQCGLDEVYLLNGYEVQDTPYGRGVSIQNVEGLHEAIADHLVRSTALLKGREIRFLRKQMELTQAELATLLRCNQQSVARWEKEKAEISGTADAIIRLLYLSARLGEVNAAEIIKELVQMDMVKAADQVFEQTADGWKRAA